MLNSEQAKLLRQIADDLEWDTVKMDSETRRQWFCRCDNLRRLADRLDEHPNEQYIEH